MQHYVDDEKLILKDFFLHQYKLNSLFFIYQFIFLFFKRFGGKWKTIFFTVSRAK